MKGATLKTVSHEVLARVLRKRLRRFMSELPGVMGGDDPKAVHNVRVWSRRLQQGFAAFFPKPRPGKARRLRRMLQRARRVLAEWRNCDVMLRLVAREQRRTRSQTKRYAWELVREYLHEKRGRQLLIAQQKLLKYDLPNFAGHVRQLLDHLTGDESAEMSVAPLHGSIENAWAQWQSALAHAEETREARDIHTFRIATKRLRYRLELMHELGEDGMLPLSNWLKELQEALGKWHDRQTLHQVMAETLARPEFLMREPGAARTLLAELEKDRPRQSAALENIFQLAVEHRDAMTWDAESAPASKDPAQNP